MKVWESRQVGPFHIIADIMRPNACSHGPQHWPRWRLFALDFVTLSCCDPGTTGYRVWIYARKAAAFTLDLYISRRVRV